MSDQEERIKISFDTNADQTKQSVDGVARAVNTTTDAVDKQEKAQVSLRQQLRNANIELQNAINKYGETSKEAIASAKAVAELKDQMEFAQQLSKSFNPDQKFKALTSASQLAGTGLQGVTSGMALFGDQSKETQAQLLKVQAAMAFSDAISNLSNVADQWNVLKTNLKDLWKVLITEKVKDTAVTATNTTATATNTATQVASTAAIATETGVKKTATITTTALTVATNLWSIATKVALAPITLIVAGISGLTLGIGYLIGAFGDFSGEALRAEVANKKLSNSIDAQVKANKKNEEQMELSRQSTLGMAKASGKSESEIRRLEKALIEQEVAEKRLNAEKLRSIAVEARRIAMTEDATDAQKATAKKSAEAYNDANAKLKEAYIERQKLNINHKIAIQQEETELNQKLADKQKEANEKRLQKQKEAKEKAERLEKEKAEKILAKEKELKKQLEDLEDDTAQKKLDRQKKRDLAEIEALGLKGKAKQDLIDIQNKINKEKQDDLDAKIKEEEKEKEKEKQEKAKAFFEQFKLEEDEKSKYKDAKTQEELDKILITAKAKIEKELEAKKLEAEAKGEDANLTPEEREEKKAEIQAFYNNKREEEEKRHKDAVIAIEKTKADHKKEIQDATFAVAEAGIGVLKSFDSKNKAIQKATILAESGVALGKVGMNIAAGVSKDAESGAVASIPMIVKTIATGVLSTAQIISGTNKALKALGGGSAPSGGGSPTQAPQGVSAQPQIGVQASNENQIATSIAKVQAEQPPIKAFVVSTEVSTAQTLDAKIIRENSF